jgi:hypothetical protein
MALTSKGHFKVNGKEFAAKAIKVGFESLSGSDSGRTEDGVMHINWIFRRIRKVEITMPPCTSEEVSELLSLVQGQEYSLTYFDPLENKEKMIGVYTSTTAADMYSGIIRNGLWQGVSFNAIEMAGEA